MLLHYLGKQKAENCIFLFKFWELFCQQTQKTHSYYHSWTAVSFFWDTVYRQLSLNVVKEWECHHLHLECCLFVFRWWDHQCDRRRPPDSSLHLRQADLRLRRQSTILRRTPAAWDPFRNLAKKLRPRARTDQRLLWLGICWHVSIMTVVIIYVNDSRCSVTVWKLLELISLSYLTLFTYNYLANHSDWKSKQNFGWGFAPDPSVLDYTAPPDFLVGGQGASFPFPSPRTSTHFGPLGLTPLCLLTFNYLPPRLVRRCHKAPAEKGNVQQKIHKLFTIIWSFSCVGLSFLPALLPPKTLEISVVSFYGLVAHFITQPTVSEHWWKHTACSEPLAWHHLFLTHHRAAEARGDSLLTPALITRTVLHTSHYRR